MPSLLPVSSLYMSASWGMTWNAAETSGDPNAYVGSANIFTLEYANGETSTITVYGNLFYKKDDGPWCDIPYEQAEKLEELVRSLGSDA